MKWHEAPLPPRLHRCHVWQVGYVGQRIERCACGAMRSVTFHRWHDRNQRRNGGDR